MKYVYLISSLLFSAGFCQAQEEDLLPERTYFRKFCAKFPLEEKPNIMADTNHIAIWKLIEDVDEHNYFVVQRYNMNQYVFTYMNRGGSNRTYENVSAYFSKVGNATFLTVPLYDHETETVGYFFSKVTDLDSRGWNMTLSLVADTTLKDITSRSSLLERIEKNVNNPNFYKAPVHLKKKLPLLYCK